MKIKTETIVRLVILFIALVNQVLTSMGMSPLPFEDETVTELVSITVTVAASAWAWWKNNSFTKEAIAADEYLTTLKKEGSVKNG